MTKNRSKASLIRILCSQQNLVSSVRNLPTPVLAQMIEKVGLEDSGELIAMSSSKQLNELMAADVWNLNPGVSEEFSSERFALWLEVLSQLSSQEIIEKVTEIDEEFLILGLSERLMVFRREDLEMYFWENGQPPQEFEEISEVALSHEFDHYWIFSRKEHHWDAILSLLMELSQKRSQTYLEIMERLATVSTCIEDEWMEFSERLSERQSLLDDVKGTRTEKRSEKGFISPEEAQSLLSLINSLSLASLIEAKHEDVISQRYFKNLKPSPIDEATIPDELLQLLIEFKVIPKQKPSSQKKQVYLNTSPFRNFLAQSPELQGELGFLGNLVLSGIPQKSKKFRPTDALEFAIDLSEQGFYYLRQNKELEVAEAIQSFGLIHLFKIGYKLSQSSDQQTIDL